MLLFGAAVIALVAVTVAATATLAGDGDATDVAAVPITGAESRVRGVAHLEQDGERLTGFVVVWGLEANTAHAVHFHGPEGRCGTKADPVAVHPDLNADAAGIAYAEVDIATERDLLAAGYYYNVHEGPSREADNPEIACGNIDP
jgi:hypothetical protein